MGSFGMTVGEPRRRVEVAQGATMFGGMCRNAFDQLQILYLIINLIFVDVMDDSPRGNRAVGLFPHPAVLKYALPAGER